MRHPPFQMSVVLLFALAMPALACNVPVFRYALERWVPDAYEVYLFHDAPLSASQQAMVESIRSQIVGAPSQQDSFYLNVVDTSAPMEERAQAVLKAAQPATDPHLVVRFPRSQPEDPPAYAGPLTKDIAENLADSPMRRAIAKQILDGESVVWVLLESGDKALDDAAATLMSGELVRLSKELTLPELDATDAKYHDPDAGPKLRMSFTMQRLSRSDRREGMFIGMLENWDAKLIDAKLPLAFAIYGRGRVLPPLSGKYLNSKFIEQASAFLVGRCSCQVKHENPGWDLLMPVDWDAVMRGRASLADAMPRLTTATAVVEENASIEQATREAMASAQSPTVSPAIVAVQPTGDSATVKNLVMLLGGGLACMVFFSVRMRAKRRKSWNDGRMREADNVKAPSDR